MVDFVGYIIATLHKPVPLSMLLLSQDASVWHSSENSSPSDVRSLMTGILSFREREYISPHQFVYTLRDSIACATSNLIERQVFSFFTYVLSNWCLQHFGLKLCR